MCGISGFMCHKSMTDYEKNNLISSMTNTLSHRGPDFQDVWVSKKNSIAIGHTRLSILDLSKNGNQPMFSNSLQYVISFNGEIYNHVQLRKKYFEGSDYISWKSNSDTETLINLIEKIGIDKTLEQVNGMFAFALYDLKNNKIIICRDKLGEKPLYYAINKNNSFLAFGSELKVFKKIDKYLSLDIRKDSLEDFFKFGNIPSPKTIFNNIYKVEPGNYIQINFNDLKLEFSNYNDLKKIFKFKKWYNITDYYNNSNIENNKDHFSGLKYLLQKSVEKQKISDVPIGSFLSGGVDSSLISSILQSQTESKIDTFTIGFSEKKYDESFYAKEIASKIGAKNHCIHMSINSLQTIFEKNAHIYDEPFSDSSQIPTILLSEYTKNNVSVVMSGDGGDELFGGYYRHFYSSNIYNFNRITPYHFRLFIIKLLNLFPTKFYSILENLHILPIDDIGTKIIKLEKLILNSNSFRSFYNNLITDKSFNNNLFSNSLSDNYDKISSSNYERKLISDQFMHWDISEYLPNDILHKVDRATMSTGLEARLPMLDEDLIEYSFSIPKKLLINRSNGKIILKKILSEYIPSTLINRPKKGFGIPINEWIKGPLFKWVDLKINNLIQNDEEKFFNNLYVKNLLIDHKAGIDKSSLIWSLLVYNNWKENF